MVADGHVESRGEPGRSVLAATTDVHVGSRSAPYLSLLRLITWSSDRFSCDDIIDLHTACWHCVLLADESVVDRFRSFKGHRSRRRRRSGRLCCSLLHCGPISVVFLGRLKQINKRICIIILLISAHGLP